MEVSTPSKDEIKQYDFLKGQKINLNPTPYQRWVTKFPACKQIFNH